MWIFLKICSQYLFLNICIKREHWNMKVIMIPVNFNANLATQKTQMKWPSGKWKLCFHSNVKQLERSSLWVGFNEASHDWIFWINKHFRANLVFFITILRKVMQNMKKKKNTIRPYTKWHDFLFINFYFFNVTDCQKNSIWKIINTCLFQTILRSILSIIK